jgi:hypothetical protein
VLLRCDMHGTDRPCLRPTTEAICQQGSMQHTVMLKIVNIKAVVQGSVPHVFGVLSVCAG